mmetsp:Transcript_23878/g.50337  ORF Transcript_23878/g.50337 Transcript_23878/m.50337 type:complete len:147 (-) Transcript_23878:2200-2640(-)
MMVMIMIMVMVKTIAIVAEPAASAVTVPPCRIGRPSLNNHNNAKAVAAIAENAKKTETTAVTAKNPPLPVAIGISGIEEIVKGAGIETASVRKKATEMDPPIIFVTENENGAVPPAEAPNRTNGGKRGTETRRPVLRKETRNAAIG